MSDYVKRLQESRLRAWNAAKEIAERAAIENRAMDGEEERSWDSHNAEVDAYDKRIQSVLAGEQRAKDTESAFAAIRGTPENKGEAELRKKNEEFENEFRSFIKKETRGNDRSGNAYEIALPTFAEKRYLGVGAGGGSVPVPTSFVNTLYNNLVDTSSVRRLNVTVISSGSGESITVPRSTAEGAAAWVAEQGTIPASDPTLSSISLSAFKAAKLIQVSYELLDDTGFDLLGFISEHAGRNIAILTDTAYVVGDGTGKPTGLMGAAGVGFTQATGNTTALTTANSGDSLIEVVHSIIPQYRRNGQWLMNDALVKIVRKLRDSTGQYLWQPGLQAGQPDRLLGYELYTDPNVASPTGANNRVAAFGDFRSYYIRDVSPMRFERSDEFAFATDMVSFRAVFRTDGKLIDSSAVKVLVNSAT